ncbi:MAG: NAD(P)H-dependent flavin oxidoreductase [Fusicatenibacter sp.]
MTNVKIGNLILERPIIQGGMGIGVSRNRLAGAVAKEGGMGVISSAQIGYDSPLFRTNPEKVNLQVLPEEIQKAKILAEGNGAVAVNIMSVTQLYGTYVKTAIDAGADAIISGAGLPLELPKYVAGSGVKIAPVVSSSKGASVILRSWDKKYQRTADFLVMESPYSGGHQGYKKEQLMCLEQTASDFDQEVIKTILMKKIYEEKYRIRIPLFVGGGIFTKADKDHFMRLGADGVQAGTRFIVTEECDASVAYKEAFLRARAEDLVIIDSPVGMPARAIRNAFVERMLNGSEEISWCYNCLKACNPATAKYCISQALINAVKGDVDNGLIFCSAKVDQIHKIQTVLEVMEDLEC